MTDRREEWVLVPKKPTLEMSRAVREETRFCDPVGIYQKMIAAAPTHPAITHCDNCGCDWLDNGLNPIGCPYCKQSEYEYTIAAQEAEIKALRAEVERLRADRDSLEQQASDRVADWHAEHLRAEQLAEALRKLEEREQRDESLLRQALEVLSRAHQAAMVQTLKARIPECAEFGGIAQDLDFVVAALRERLGEGAEP